MQGYAFSTARGQRLSPPVIRPDLPVLDGILTLSFLDLQEIRFVDAFLNAGVSWKHLRAAHEEAAVQWGPHPFSRGRFITDGRIILERAGATIVEAVSKQSVFKKVIAPYIVNLSFADGQASEWWPMGKKGLIVLNPKRSFGQPITAREGVPTAILAKAYKAEQSYTRVARWYEVKEKAVRNAVAYEANLAA